MTNFSAGMNAAERSIRLGEAAKDAVKHLAHVSLAHGDISRIVSQAAMGGNIADAVRQVQSLALTTAQAYVEQQRNQNITTSQQTVNGTSFGLGVAGAGMLGLNRFPGWDGIDGGGGGGAVSGRSSSYHLAGLGGSGGASGISPSVFADFSRQYSGMGFTPGMINTFANVNLHRSDFAQIEQRWGRPATVRAARRTEELGLRGRQDVDDSAGISDREHDLNRQYLRATTEEERQRIRGLMGQEAPRQGETPVQQEQRQRRRLERLDQVNQRDAQQNPDRARTNADTELQSNQMRSGLGQSNTSSVQNHMGQRANGRTEENTLADLFDSAGSGRPNAQHATGNPTTVVAPQQQDSAPAPQQAATNSAAATGSQPAGTPTNGNGEAGNRPTHAARANAGPTPA